MISIPIRTTTIVHSLEEFIPLAQGKPILEWWDDFWYVTILKPDSIDDYILHQKHMDCMYVALHNGNLIADESPFAESQDENQF